MKPLRPSEGLTSGPMQGWQVGVFHGPERRLREEITGNPAGRGPSRPEVPGLAGVEPALPLAFPPIVPAPLPGILPD